MRALLHFAMGKVLSDVLFLLIQFSLMSKLELIYDLSSNEDSGPNLITMLYVVLENINGKSWMFSLPSFYMIGICLIIRERFGN